MTPDLNLTDDKLKKCEHYDITLEPGDILVNPELWIHGFINLSDKPTVAVSYRFSRPWYTANKALYQAYKVISTFLDVRVLYRSFYEPTLPRLMYTLARTSNSCVTRNNITQAWNIMEEDPVFKGSRAALDKN